MAATIGAGLLVGLGACEIERTVGLSSDPSLVQSVSRSLHFTGRSRIDALFLIDDANGMAEPQRKLQEQLVTIVAGLVGPNRQRDVRVGVLTSDLGAPGVACGTSREGRLQPVGAAASPGCVAPGGAPWLSLTPHDDNLPAGQTLEQTLRCMTAVGDQGCGFTMPLEALRRQLLAPPEGDPPFVRDDALLLVVVLANADDCSAPPGSVLFSSDPQFGPLTPFRCDRYGVLCGGGLISNNAGSYESCRPAIPADGGQLVDLSTYLDLLGKPRAAGGIKDDPADVLVAGLYGPPTPFITAWASGAACGGVAACTLMVHSCQAPSDPLLYGDPGVRLNTLFQATGGLSHPICDTSYEPFAEELSARVTAAATGNACIPGAVADPGAPACTVTYAGTTVPLCDAGQGGVCWTAESDPSCPVQVDPRDGTLQTLHLRVLEAPADQVSATCVVLTAQ
jgi:hypothetical protein